MLVKYRYCHKYLKSSIRKMFGISSNIEVSEQLIPIRNIVYTKYK